MKGCYVYFEDQATREFFESRVDFKAVRRSVQADAAAESQGNEVVAEVEA